MPVLNLSGYVDTSTEVAHFYPIIQFQSNLNTLNNLLTDILTTITLLPIGGEYILNLPKSNKKFRHYRIRLRTSVVLNIANLISGQRIFISCDLLAWNTSGGQMLFDAQSGKDFFMLKDEDFIVSSQTLRQVIIKSVNAKVSINPINLLNTGYFDLDMTAATSRLGLGLTMEIYGIK